MNGIINIYKPQDYTSFDCVAVLRKATCIKKIGHSGTLDPMATGVLACMIGRATRTIDYLGAETKEYIATFELGYTSDTCDIWGNVKKKDLKLARTVDADKAKSVLQGFIGQTDQIPPMYSAVKVAGKKLYEYARKGEKAEVKPRKVRIDEIEILDFKRSDVPVIEIRMVCGKGTYVRSLCRDFGEKLGCGAVMASLERTRNGSLKKEDAINIEKIKGMGIEELKRHIMPMDALLDHIPKLEVSRKEACDLINGKRIENKSDIKSKGYIRMYAEGAFIGIANYSDKYNALIAHKILFPEFKDEV